MPIRRARRNGARPQTLLPLRSGDLPNSISCWYCDFKIYALNKLLFSFGRQHARFLRVWFAIGVAFSFLAVVGVTMMLLWESIGAFHLYTGTFGLSDLLSWLFGISPLVRSFSIPTMDTGIMVFSTLMSVAIHEFGHAIAAASEGIQSEYIAIFLAILFPGALVAFNNDLLQSLPYFAALQVYCAGIWHNLMFCAVCGLTLFLLPSLLYPVHIYGKGPMVLELAEASPLSGYLFHGDVIQSVDGSNMNSPREWMEMMDQIHTRIGQEAVNGTKGYCVPNPWVEAGKNTLAADDPFSCPNELAAFVDIFCFNSSLLVGNNSIERGRSKMVNKSCLMAKVVAKLKKCGEGWQLSGNYSNNCTCVEEESCMAPVVPPGMSWVEISYSSPYSSECSRLSNISMPADSESRNSGSTPCKGTFVFVGDVLSLASSVKLSAYRPRWSFLVFTASIPTLLEKILTCNFHVSATLGLLNSLPVYFLDGESIVETGLRYITWLSPRQRHRVLRICLIGGTIISIVAFSKTLYFTLLS